jgi:hypothetical protein
MTPDCGCRSCPLACKSAYSFFFLFSCFSGACGETNVESDFIVALNAFQFGTGYPGPNCFKTITMKYNGKKVIARIMDMVCFSPKCQRSNRKLSPFFFGFSAQDAHTVRLTFRVVCFASLLQKTLASFTESGILVRMMNLHSPAAMEVLGAVEVVKVEILRFPQKRQRKRPLLRRIINNPLLRPRTRATQRILYSRLSMRHV